MPDTIPTPENTTRPTTRSVRSQIRISRVTVERSSRNLIIKLPISAAQYLNIGEQDSVYATPINGVVQISGFQPNIAIPVASQTEEDYVEQP